MRNKYSMKEMSLVKEIENDKNRIILGKVLTNKNLNNILIESLMKFINDYFREIGLIGSEITLNDVIEFNNAYNCNPSKNSSGGTRYNDLIWLISFCKHLNPKIVIESGVYSGKSLWMLRKAVPIPKLIAFDLHFKQLKFKDESIHFIESDWSMLDTKAVSNNDLCYFDDHINNCLRIKQAYEKGFKHLIFDDSPSVMNLHRYRYPGVPTAQMLLDNNLTDGDEISWLWKDKFLKYVYKESDTFEVGKLIDKIIVLPSLKKYTGIDEASDFVYVKLK